MSPIVPALDLTLDSLLEGTALPHLNELLANEDLSLWAEMTRVALLSRLKDIGVKRLMERQALANAFGRAQRGHAPDWKAPKPSATPRPAQAPPKPSPPPYLPVYDSASASQPLPTQSTRNLVRRALLSDSAEFEDRSGYVRYRPQAGAAAFESWTEPFGECPDKGCGCSRLREPRVRSRFRNFVVSRTAVQLAKASVIGKGGKVRSAADADPSMEVTTEPFATEPPPPVRYVSVGCGRMLSDFEILCGLAERGFRIEHICVVDTEYRTRSGLEAFRALAAFFSPARVVAFDGLGALKAAAKRSPEEYGGATTFCQIDANGIGGVTARALAARLLVRGGHFFELRNEGPRKAPRSCYRRRPMPNLNESPPEDRVATDPAWAELLTQVEFDEAEGRVDPLGAAEPDESWERPLWSNEGSEAAHSLPGTAGSADAWQNKHANANATMNDQSLSDALSLL